MIRISFSGIEMSDWESEQLRDSLTPILERFSGVDNASLITTWTDSRYESTLKVKTTNGAFSAYAAGSSPLSSGLQAVYRASDLVESLQTISNRGGGVHVHFN